MVWRQILADKRQHTVAGFIGTKPVTACTVVIVPNLTHSARPYALVENVITDAGHRKQGFATAALNYAREIALRENCYKLMLLTGSKEESTLRFYEQAGYNRCDKTGFVQWL